uniref:Uncharacterized protein n=1 Tax=Arundo donax TaxID=35708 RepID=A0A0A8ZW09_ARUDO
MVQYSLLSMLVVGVTKDSPFALIISYLTKPRIEWLILDNSYTKWMSKLLFCFILF